MQDAAIEAVLDALAERMNWSGAVRPRQRHGPARARRRHRLQGLDLADHVGRDRQRQRRRQRARSIAARSTWGRAPTPPMAQIVAEVLDMPAEKVRGRASATPT